MHDNFWLCCVTLTCEVAISLTMDDLKDATRKDLQSLAKRYGIRANISSEKLRKHIEKIAKEGNSARTRMATRKRKKLTSNDLKIEKGKSSRISGSNQHTSGIVCDHLDSVDFSAVRQTLENPDHWVCLKCDNGLDPRICLQDGACFCRDCSTAHAQDFDSKALFFIINSEENEVIWPSRNAIVSNDNPAGQIKHLRSILRSLQGPQAKHLRTGEGFLSMKSRNLRRQEDLRLAAVCRWRSLLLTRCFNTWKAYKSLRPDSAESEEIDEEMLLPRLKRQFSHGADSVVRTAMSHSEGRSELKRTTIPSLCPGRCGLRNLGNTCYMNSVVQVLSSLPAMRDFYIKSLSDKALDSAKKDDKMPSKKAQKQARVRRKIRGKFMFSTLSKAAVSLRLGEIFRCLWSGKRVVFTADDMLDAVWKLAPQFEGFKQQDAQEFLLFFLNQLEVEYNKNHPQAKTRDKKIGISDYFFGLKTQSIVECANGHVSRGAVTSTFMLSAQISTDSASYGRRRSSGKGSGQRFTLQECLKSTLKQIDRLEGENRYQCDTCKCKLNAIRFTKITKLPQQSLIIHLLRTEIDPRSYVFFKNQAHVSFPLESLDMTPYIDENPNGEKYVYDLVGVVNHHGKGLNQGHFTAYGYNDVQSKLHTLKN
ncbi:hypothetical protein AAMO2058_000675100 [Amorphochlora amoebiformis]